MSGDNDVFPLHFREAKKGSGKEAQNYISSHFKLSELKEREEKGYLSDFPSQLNRHVDTAAPWTTWQEQVSPSRTKTA